MLIQNMLRQRCLLVHDFNAAKVSSEQLINQALGITVAKDCADAHGETTAERFSYSEPKPLSWLLNRCKSSGRHIFGVPVGGHCWGSLLRVNAAVTAGG